MCEIVSVTCAFVCMCVLAAEGLERKERCVCACVCAYFFRKHCVSCSECMEKCVSACCFICAKVFCLCVCTHMHLKN